MQHTRSWLLFLLGLAGLTLVGCPTPSANDDDATGDDDDATEDAAPGDVTALSATQAAGAVDLAWTNPADADLAATLVVVGSSVTFAPTDGETYTADQDLGDGQTVVSAALGETASWTTADTAPLAFSAWAMDAAGQFSAAAATATIDSAPGAITGLSATSNGTEMALAWTSPTDSDLSGALIVWGTAPVTFSPAAGTAYTADEDLGGGQRVAFVGTGDSATITPALIGPDLYFSAWAFDGADNYSETSATASERRLALGTQTATLEVSLANQTVTVTGQPTDLTLSGTVSAYDDSLDTLSIALTAQNDTGRILFNLKAITDAVTGGAQTGDTFWVEADKPYTYFGPEGILPGAAIERTLAFDTVDATSDPVLVELHFMDAAMIFGGNYSGDFTGLDTAMSGETFEVSFDDPDQAGDNVRQAVVSRDGRWIYAGEKQSPMLTIIDTTTFEVAGGANLNRAANGEGNVGGVAIAPDGATLYAVFNDGSHWHGYSDAADSEAVPTTVSVMAFELPSLNPVGETLLYSNDASSRTGREMAISPDGSRVAVVLSNHDGDVGELWILDTASLGEFLGDDDDSAGDDDDSAGDDDDSANPPDGAQVLTLTGLGQPQYLDWSTDGSTLAVGYNAYRFGTNGDAVIDLIAADTLAVTTVTPSDCETSSVNSMYGGNLYYACRENDTGSALSVIAVSDGAVTAPVVDGPSEASGVLVEPSGLVYWLIDDSDAYPFDVATNAQIDGDGDSTNGLTELTMDEQLRAHFMVMTPF